MRNIDFIRPYSRWRGIFKQLRKIANPYYENDWDEEYLYEGYKAKEALSEIKQIYELAKTNGLTEEQRTSFFDMVKNHNKAIRRMIFSIQLRNGYSNQSEKVYFDESELGAYAGWYSLGDDREEDEDFTKRISYQITSLNNCIFSIKGEHIKADKAQRISLKQTIQKWKEFENYVFDDTILPYIAPSHEDLPF